MSIIKNFNLFNLTIPQGLPWQNQGDNALTAMQDMYTAIKPIIVPLCILGAMVCGFTLMLGDEHTVDTAKHWLANIIVGLILFIAIGTLLGVSLV